MATYVFRSDKYGTLKLAFLPVGYDKLKRTFERSKKWHSVSPYYDQDLKFIKDGADYLSAAYEQDGVEAVVFLDVYREDGQDLVNVLQYTCKIDFVLYERNHEGMVTIGLEKTGFAIKLKNSEKVKVDLTSVKPLEGELKLPQLLYRDIVLHSKSILKQTTMQFEEQEEPVYFPEFNFFNFNQHKVLWGLVWAIPTDKQVAAEIEESHSLNSAYIANFENSVFGPQDTPENSNLYNFKFKEAGTASITVNFDAVLDIRMGGRSVKVNPFFIIKKVRGDVETVLINDELAYYDHSGPDTKRVLSLTGKYSLGSEKFNVDDELYIYLNVKHELVYAEIIENITVNTFSISVTSMTSAEASTSKGIYFGDAYSRVIESLTGQIGAFDNSFYELFDGYRSEAEADQLPGKRILMSGIHARGWDFAEKPLVVTLADLFDTAHTLDAVGMGVKLVEKEYKAYVAPVKEFYHDEVVLSLGVVTGLKKRQDAELLYSQIMVGYNKHDTDSTNSLDEFNTTREYKTYITAHDGVYEVVSPFRADGYGLETARRQSKLANPNKSTNYDKDTFVVCFARAGSGIVSEDGVIFISCTGLIDPATAYNARISPARVFRKHEKLFTGCLQKAPDKSLMFTDAAVNTRMASRIEGETNVIVESGQRKNEQHDSPIFLNETYEFQAVLTDEDIQELEADPHGTIQFQDENRKIKQGYLMKADIDFNNLASFTLQRKFKPQPQS